MPIEPNKSYRFYNIRGEDAASIEIKDKLPYEDLTLALYQFENVEDDFILKFAQGKMILELYYMDVFGDSFRTSYEIFPITDDYNGASQSEDGPLIRCVTLQASIGKLCNVSTPLAKKEKISRYC